MRVAVQFFSQLKEIAGTAEQTIDLEEDATIADLLARLYQIHPALEKWDRNILLGSGVEFVTREHCLSAGEEIAIMPPVQGG